MIGPPANLGVMLDQIVKFADSIAWNKTYGYIPSTLVCGTDFLRYLTKHLFKEKAKLHTIFDLVVMESPWLQSSNAYMVDINGNVVEKYVLTEGELKELNGNDNETKPKV